VTSTLQHHEKKRSDLIQKVQVDAILAYSIGTSVGQINLRYPSITFLALSPLIIKIPDISQNPGKYAA